MFTLDIFVCYKVLAEIKRHHINLVSFLYVMPFSNVISTLGTPPCIKLIPKNCCTVSGRRLAQ